MYLSDLKPAKGARKSRKRIGRGESSGQGKTAGKGHKGQKARTGSKGFAGFEGGQVPLSRRLPKFGFTSVHSNRPAIVNLRDLERFDAGAIVDIDAMKASGLVRTKHTGKVKILGEGEMKKALTIKASAFSKKALELIQKAGGMAEVIETVLPDSWRPGQKKTKWIKSEATAQKTGEKA